MEIKKFSEADAIIKRIKELGPENERTEKFGEEKIYYAVFTKNAEEKVEQLKKNELVRRALLTSAEEFEKGKPLILIRREGEVYKIEFHYKER